MLKSCTEDSADDPSFGFKLKTVRYRSIWKKYGDFREVSALITVTAMPVTASFAKSLTSFCSRAFSRSFSSADIEDPFEMFDRALAGWPFPSLSAAASSFWNCGAVDCEGYAASGLSAPL